MKGRERALSSARNSEAATSGSQPTLSSLHHIRWHNKKKHGSKPLLALHWQVIKDLRADESVRKSFPLPGSAGNLPKTFRAGSHAATGTYAYRCPVACWQFYTLKLPFFRYWDFSHNPCIIFAQGWRASFCLSLQHSQTMRKLYLWN